MSPHRRGETFQIIASLPRPIDPVKGRSLVTPVQALSGNKRRKRAEAAVTIDGEGVQIYDVQTARLVTSYAVPPHSYFTHSPCSLYRRRNKKSRPSRVTFVSTRDTLPAQKAQVLCFVEEHLPGSAADIKTLSCNPPSSEARVVAIEPVLDDRTERESPRIPRTVCVLENGGIFGLNTDFSLAWESGLESLTAVEESERLVAVTVEYVSMTNASAARKGFLRSREDLVASLQSSPEDGQGALEAIPVLCIVSKTKASGEASTARYFSILRLHSVSSEVLRTRRSPIQHVVTWQLPEPDDASVDGDETLKYCLHSTSGTLQQLRNGAILTYDFSGTVPRLFKNLQLPDETFYSFIRISLHRVMACSSSICGLYDTSYASLHSAFDLTQISSAKSPNRRGRSRREPKVPKLILSEHFASLGLAIGLLDGVLVGIQLEDGSSTRKKRVDGLLIDAIGRGIKPTSGIFAGVESSNDFLRDVYAHSGSREAAWLAQERELDLLAAADDVHGFEDLFARILHINPVDSSETERSHDPPKKSKKKDDVAMVNGVESERKSDIGSPLEFGSMPNDEGQLREWQFPPAILDEDRVYHRHKAIYALSKLFAWNDHSSQESGEGEIKLTFLPPNVLQWVVLMGCFTKNDIERALRLKSAATDKLRSLNDGDIVSAIVSFNPDMILLDSILNQSCHLPAAELVQAIKLLIQSLDTKPTAAVSARKHRARNEVDDRDSSDGAVTDLDVDEAAEDASDAIDLALSTLEYGLPIRSRTLHAALTKLHAFPPRAVARALHARLTHHELIFLIHLLRIELRDGGWLSRYTAQTPDTAAAAPDEVAAQPADHAIVTIASLLNCALDAVGTAGWLSSSATTTSTSASSSSTAADGNTLLRALQQEAAAALEGAHELAYLRSVIGEFLRYAGRVEDREALAAPPALPANHHHYHQPQHQNARKGKRKHAADAPAPVVPPSTAEMDSDPPRRARALPLGLRPPDPYAAAGSSVPVAAGAGGASVSTGAAWGVAETRAGDGGRRKSRREVGREISARVPRYAVERIAV